MGFFSGSQSIGKCLYVGVSSGPATRLWGMEMRFFFCLFVFGCNDPLHEQCEGCQGYAGRTPLPQGLDILVLETADIDELLRRYKLHFM